MLRAGRENYRTLIVEAKKRAKSEFKQKVLEEKIEESLKSNGKVV